MMKICTIEDAFDHCGVTREVIIHYIDEEWIRPWDLEDYSLDEEDLARIRLIHELEDFGVNDDSMPIILQLLDQLNRLHLEIEKLNQHTT